MTLGYITDLRNNQLDEITTEVGADGLLRIFSGVRPATGGAETTMLVELACSATFAPAAAAGMLPVNAITDGVAVASGTPTWARFCKANGAPVVDMSAGVAGGDLSLDKDIVDTGNVSVSAASFTAGNA